MSATSERAPGEPVKWYRCPVGKEALAQLNRRSDFWGALQTFGFLGVLALTGSAAFFAAGRAPWPVVVLLVFLHGSCWSFINNGFHEFLHDSVFKSRLLNRVFCFFFCFLSQHNVFWFWASHMEHHKFTLHTPDDKEVVLPQTFNLKSYLKVAFVNLHWRWWSCWWILRLSAGRMEKDGWERQLFEHKPAEFRKACNWARVVLIGHTAIVAVSCYYGLWMLPLLTTFAPYYGAGVQWLCNQVQHAGLCDNKPDFRLCVRTVYLNPFLQFMYWHMNYHTEHHMFAAVPCYNLGALHRQIKHDMPRCPNGLYEAWTQIAEIQKRQKQDPAYQYAPELPQALNCKHEARNTPLSHCQEGETNSKSEVQIYQTAGSAAEA